MKNLGTMDRLLRVILAELCILVAFFWAAEEWQIPLYLIAGVMLLQAATATCGVYTMLGRNSCEIIKRQDKNLMTIFIVTALVLAVVGSYASAVLTKNIFLEDLGDVSEAYSLALQYSGEGDRENATEEFGKLESTFGNFQAEIFQIQASYDQIRWQLHGSNEQHLRSDIRLQGRHLPGQSQPGPGRTEESRADHPKDAEKITA